MESQRQLPPASDDIEISLSDIIKPLVVRRWFIAGFSLFIAALSLGITFVVSPYKSGGQYYFYGPLKPAGADKTDGGGPQLDLAYDRILGMARTLERFDAYLAAQQQEITPEIEQLRSTFTEPKSIDEFIVPLYVTQFKDPEYKPKKDDAQIRPLIGLKLEVPSKDPVLAHRMSILLTRYLVDTVLYEIFQDRLGANLHMALQQEAKVENELFSLALKRPHLLRQISEIETLITKYSKLFESNAQVQMRLSTEDSLGSSPVLKLMAAQLELAALDAQVERLQRQQRQTHLMRAFYSRSLDSHQAVDTVEPFVSQQRAILQEVFQGQDMNDDAIREIYNAFEIRNEDISNLYQENLRRVVQPSLPTARTIETSLKLVGALSFIVGLMLACFIVWFRAWWQAVSATNSAPNSVSKRAVDAA